MKLAITSGLIIGMAIVIIHVLIKVAIYGEVLIKEPILNILVAELVVYPAIIIYGIWLFVKGEK